LRLLYTQYTSNNLYMYPEHCDYQPGHNGTILLKGPPGYGDLYPTNTPFVIISQGSSGTDQPFMNAVAMTMAAFQPKVKRRLADCGLLMPTIQMIFRMSNKQLSGPKDYLTGKAHPPVFQGDDVDPVKMVQMAHDMKVDEMPPMIGLAAIEEDHATQGRDFFDRSSSENIADTPAVIPRICRSVAYTRRMVVSAEESYDRNGRPLEYHWVLLRGDPEKVSIKLLNAKGSRAEILVSYQDRRPIAPGAQMESNRVDIGVFVHNGVYYSAPGFVTFSFLDNEARTYEGGRLLEIGYGAGDNDIIMCNWQALADALKPAATSATAKLLKKTFSPAEAAVIVAAGEKYHSLEPAASAAHEKRERLDREKKPEAEIKAAREVEQATAKARDDAIAAKLGDSKESVKDVVNSRLRAMLHNPTFYQDNAEIMKEFGRNPRYAAALPNLRRRFVAWGIFQDKPDGVPEIRGIRGATNADTAKLTRFERTLLEQFNGDLLDHIVFEAMVHWEWTRNYVDPVLTAPRSWRDVYHYDAAGHCTGWTRYDGQQASDFRADGWLVKEKDAQGRCHKGCAVRYEQERPADGEGHRFWFSDKPLHWTPDGPVVTFKYADDKDWKGREVSEEAGSAAEKK
jgi:hypothetical protein